jgi:SAM-dependent methyltransferase
VEYYLLVVILVISLGLNVWGLYQWQRRKRKKRELRRIQQQAGQSTAVPTPTIVNQISVAKRPEAWEDDISYKALDSEPFENRPPICDYSFLEIRQRFAAKSIEAAIGAETLSEMTSKDRFPIPSIADREGYNSASDIDYWLGGLDDYLKVMGMARQYSVEPRSVLDFGCSTGRFIRHFLAQSEVSEIWGTDINGRHIRWLHENLPSRVKPIFNHCLPTLPIRDNSVDIISAFSVFTHIDTFETCWIAELARIMNDNGFCYITVHNEDTWELLRDQADNPKNRLIQSMLTIDSEIASKIHQPMPDTRTSYRFTQSGPYRAQVFHSNNYLKNVWGRFFKVEAILPAYHVRQSVVILRKL